MKTLYFFVPFLAVLLLAPLTTLRAADGYAERGVRGTPRKAPPNWSGPAPEFKWLEWA